MLENIQAMTKQNMHLC